MRPDQNVIDNVARKFQEFASQLPDEEQEALATWMAQRSGDDVQGFSAAWWNESDAYANQWRESWSGE